MSGYGSMSEGRPVGEAEQLLGNSMRTNENTERKAL